MFSIYVHSFFGLSTFFVFKAGSPQYLCRLPNCVVCVTLCVVVDRDLGLGLGRTSVFGEISVSVSVAKISAETEIT